MHVMRILINIGHMLNYVESYFIEIWYIKENGGALENSNGISNFVPFMQMWTLLGQRPYIDEYQTKRLQYLSFQSLKVCFNILKK